MNKRLRCGEGVECGSGRIEAMLAPASWNTTVVRRR